MALACAVVALALAGTSGCALDTDGLGSASCREMLMRNPAAASGFYTLDLDRPGRPGPQRVYCEMSFDGGGWTLFHAPDIGDFAPNAGLPRCGSLHPNGCFAGTYVQRGNREGLYLVRRDGMVFELTAELTLVGVAAGDETHGPCPGDAACDGGDDRCLFSRLLDGPGCCSGGGQNNVCLH